MECSMFIAEKQLYKLVTIVWNHYRMVNFIIFMMYTIP